MFRTGYEARTEADRVIVRKTDPHGLKAARDDNRKGRYGTVEAVPFQNSAQGEFIGAC